MSNIAEMKGITKHFPGVRALHNVDLEVRAGEVHALVGENGAGKSTMIKILMGVHQKTEGEIFFDGAPVDIKNPLHAQSLGLGAVYQDVNLALHLSVAENLFMGQLPKNKFGIVNHAEMYRETTRIMESINVNVNPRAIVNTLSVALQEMVCIGKILRQNAKLVIFDEPTALLTTEETEQLFQIIHMLKEQGVGVLYISHRMEEIFRICDRTTILKDGEKVATVNTADVTEDDVISMMVGRSVQDMYGIEHVPPGEEVLSVKGLSRKNEFQDINFEIQRGEIFGMFGLVGSGRTEIVHSIFGASKPDRGTVTYKGAAAGYKNPRRAIKAGLALLPEDRKGQGLALGLTVTDNTNMASMGQIATLGVLDNRKGTQIAASFVEKLSTKTPSVYQLVKNLSGGNQQKVVISKWLAADSEFFIFDEPTVGVDVGAKVEIYKIFENLVKEGKTILIISSYLPEIMGLAERMLVMYEGKQMGILTKDQFDEERILRLASGIQEQERSDSPS
ncbi:MAG: sugar ABC transporter ATP-binding protein [Oscillospiraceae bacterium]|nr:sugar ABC transporter ATP-binding protein [Oscillospiraceae bacterium]